MSGNADFHVNFVGIKPQERILSKDIFSQHTRGKNMLVKTVTRNIVVHLICMNTLKLYMRVEHTSVIYVIIQLHRKVI